MPDPVNTDALRDLQALSGGILSRNLLEGSGVWKINRDTTLALGSAADEVDRLRAELMQAEQDVTNAENDGIRWMERTNQLRAVIENAPHESACPARLPATFTRPMPCTCWKADAL